MPVELSPEKRVLDPFNTDVVVLCGGMGKRLQSVINDRPKPMAQIGDKPFLDILIDYTASYGFRRFILCTGHKQGFISDYYKDKFRDAPLIEIIISGEQTPLGTAGAIKNAQGVIKSKVFLVMNGDSFCQLDLRDFLRFHEINDAFISMVLVYKENISDCGLVEINSDKVVMSFIEKSLDAKKGYINGGIYLFNKESQVGSKNIFDFVPQGQSSLEYEVFPKVIERGIYGYITTGMFIDIGTPERYSMARDYLKQ